MRTRFIAEVDPKWLAVEIDYFSKHIEEDNPAIKIEAPDPALLVDRSLSLNAGTLSEGWYPISGKAKLFPKNRRGV